MAAPDTYYPEVIHRTPVGSGGAGVSYVLYCALAGIAFGLLGGFVWSKIADPPVAIVGRDGNAYLAGEIGYDQQSTVTFWYLTVGLGLGLLAGLMVAWRGRRHGVASVIGVLALTAVASWLGGYLGMHVFGPDQAAQLAAANPGDLITAGLTVGTKVAYLGWPIGGLVGAIVAIAFWPASDKSTEMPPWSGTVVTH